MGYTDTKNYKFKKPDESNKFTVMDLNNALDQIDLMINKVDSDAKTTDKDHDVRITKAQETADNGVSKADAAQSTANTAIGNARTAQESANKAQETADNGIIAAGNAQSTADKAQSTADKAQSTADNAHTRLDNIVIKTMWE